MSKMKEYLKMFSNIGKKIKTLAKVICIIGIVISFFFGFWMMNIELFDGNKMTVPGLIIILGGSLISWISSFFIYGFGELIESNVLILRSLNGNAANVDIEINDRLRNLDKLYAQHLITEEEYTSKRKEILDE